MRKQIIIASLVLICLISVALNFVLGRNGGHNLTAGDGQRIGVIKIDGTIAGSEADAGLLNTVTTTNTVMEQISAARDDASIKAVVLRINSPGGSASASQEIAEEIQKLRKDGKIVVTSMGDEAASGAYWIAAGTDRIVANPATMTGSIGVIMPLQNYTGLYQKLGIQNDPVKSSAHKDIGSSARKMTTEERAILQSMVDDIYAQFIDVVVQGRHLSKAKVRQLADQSVFTGRQALKAGLIDELGDYYDAIASAKKLAKLNGDVEIVDLSAANPLSTLFGRITGLQGLLNKQVQSVTVSDYSMPWLISPELGGAQ